MNDKQIAWTKKQQDTLNDYIMNNYPLSDMQWEEVRTFIDNKVTLAKSSGDEVREMLFDIVEQWEIKRMRDNGIYI